MDKTCRICGLNIGTSYIFAAGNGLRVSAKILYCCHKVSIEEGDGLPAHICRSCEEEVDMAYRFVLKCESTDQRLRADSMSDLAEPDSLSSSSSVSKPNDYKPKVEVKVEDSGDSDSDTVYQDIPAGCAAFEKKDESCTKSESKTTKRVRKSYKKITKCVETDIYKCSICGCENATSSALAVHMRYHTSKTQYPCPSCDKKYKDQASLKRHTDMHHTQSKRERKFICENCGKGFFSKSDVKIHMRTHTGETPYACTECRRRFSQTSGLVRHMRRHAGDKRHICDTCNKRFCTKNELQYHMQVHTDEKKYSCTICNIPFKYQNNLTKHMKLHSTPKSFICVYCGQSFNQKGNLKGHIDRQHSEKSGYCDVCSKYVSDHEVHMWRHTGERPLKCDQCTRCFSEMKTLTRHINYRHKYPEKFECLFKGCGMKFPARTMLEFHTAKLHKTGIPFPCDRCTRGFYRKNDLARHKIGTHKEKL